MFEMNARNIAMIAMGRPFETDEEQKFAIRKKFTWTVRLLNSTLIYYGTKKSGRLNAVTYYLRMALAYFLTGFALFSSVVLFFRLIDNWGAETNIVQIVMLSWALQCFLIMVDRQLGCRNKYRANCHVVLGIAVFFNHEFFTLLAK
uniref:Gustatory receptor n=1 Tax=Panagrolaimus sp. JU765 TaxID=591449 RepID=A0AC34QIH3_9BILA